MAGADSLHRLVMDLHKRLNAMQAELAEETMDGAAAYNLAEADRPLVSAFMAGLNRTAKLKFTHPGLATTATRAGGRLVIQNDIGTTDAHVIVIHVQGLAVSVTYTDVHAERLAFFQDMLKAHAVTWESERTGALAAGAPFYLATGRIEAADADACRAYLEFLGSRLVFLIDWNRARKQLRGFLRGAGSRGAVALGGGERRSGIAASWNWAARGWSTRRSRPPRDRRCISATGCATCSATRRRWSSCASCSKTATEGLLSGQSHGLIHDRIRVALATHFSNEERQLLRLAGDHAGLIFEIASLVRDGLQAEPDGADKRARRARRFEHDADQLVLATREAVRRRPDYAVFLPLLEAADDAADELEDAAFFLDLDTLRGQAAGGVADTWPTCWSEASQEWIKALGHAAQIGRAASRAETEDFLTAIDRIAALEHRGRRCGARADGDRRPACAGFPAAASVHGDRRQARGGSGCAEARQPDPARTRAEDVIDG